MRVVADLAADASRIAIEAVLCFKGLSREL
jgi:hypothetical protein